MCRFANCKFAIANMSMSENGPNQWRCYREFDLEGKRLPVEQRAASSNRVTFQVKAVPHAWGCHCSQARRTRMPRMSSITTSVSPGSLSEHVSQHQETHGVQMNQIDTRFLIHCEPKTPAEKTTEIGINQALSRPRPLRSCFPCPAPRQHEERARELQPTATGRLDRKR
jgi:hypothetical protein